MDANTPARANGAVKKKPACAKAVSERQVRVSVVLFRHSCRYCSYVAANSSDKVARSVRDRHERETHGPNAAHRRLTRARYMAGYMMAYRRNMDPKMDCVKDVSVYVLCTTRREDEHRMSTFTETKVHLIASGFHRANIHQLHGAGVRVSKEIGESQCVMWAFLNKFIPTALNHFKKAPETRYVLFCESGVRMEPGFSAEDVNEEAMHAYPTACRMGWYNSAGLLQMASFSLEAIQHFKAMKITMLHSCDSWWGSLKDVQMASGVNLMKFARSNIGR